jgi:RNA polymerase sigma-70 factor (ECF subfamily)
MEPPPKKLTHQQFIRLFSQSESELIRYLMALLPNSSDARDVLQETAVSLWQTIEKYDPTQPFFPWACRFALNKARQYLRTEARRSRVFDEDVAGLIAARRVEISVHLEKRREYLEECLKRLPNRQKVLVQSYYFEDQSIGDVAKYGGLSVEAVYKALQRTRQALMACIERKLQSER